MKAKNDFTCEWYENVKVYCNSELVLEVGSTRPELSVDVWSGNHPSWRNGKFCPGESREILDSEGRVKRFMAKYGLVEKNE